MSKCKAKHKTKRSPIPETYVACQTTEIASEAMMDLMADGRAVISIPIHSIIDELVEKLRLQGTVDLGAAELRAKSPAVLLVVTPKRT